jgi:hypothetical protein
VFCFLENISNNAATRMRPCITVNAKYSDTKSPSYGSIKITVKHHVALLNYHSDGCDELRRLLLLFSHQCLS